MKRFLYPGMRIKRWLGLLTLGLVLTSAGVATWFVELERARPGALGAVDSLFGPTTARISLLLGLGLLAVLLSAMGVYRSIAEVVEPIQPGRGGFLDLIYQARVRRGGPRVVCVGGGTGMPTVLRALKPHTSNITAVVTVGDDGGSSGRLRREHGILPPGDFRNNIVALAEVEPLMSRLFQYRFGPGSSLEGHSFGNLFVLAMTGVTGNFEQALRETSRVLAVKGSILPSTLEDVTIWARFKDGTEVEGESQVPEVGKPLDRVYLHPEHPSAQPEAVKAILEADLVVLGPGSLYTSVIPNLLVEGIAKALEQTEATTVYVCNVAVQPGETDGYSVQDHVAAIARHLPGRKNPLTYVVINQSAVASSSEGDVAMVCLAPRVERIDSARVVVADVVRTDQPLRHDPEKLGQVLVALAEHRRR
ncbi:MAG: YvcK family protein [Chloroflexi bacterium]|nr:YvcK family protein [Chloroflexota bacterium]